MQSLIMVRLWPWVVVMFTARGRNVYSQCCNYVQFMAMSGRNVYSQLSNYGRFIAMSGRNVYGKRS